ncbi:glycosyltransferase family 4 protein, partial [Acrocarpospora sp. B8E8]|uniref:glycosyltransferase n=1 Tax=Acrocarpospora sp. B8E8 TaxID=3153572 RepID=UPI00325D9A9B
MRIVLVLGTSSGGVGRHVRTLAHGLTTAGHDVLVAGPPTTQSTFNFSQTGATFAPLPISDRPHPLNDFRTTHTLRKLLGDADIVHAHGLRAGALAALALPSRKVSASTDIEGEGAASTDIGGGGRVSTNVEGAGDMSDGMKEEGGTSTDIGGGGRGTADAEGGIGVAAGQPGKPEGGELSFGG